MKHFDIFAIDKLDGSPPTRGAWIETSAPSATRSATPVAPHAGGVDWNGLILLMFCKVAILVGKLAEWQARCK